MKETLKRFLLHTLPGPAHAIQSARQRRHIRRFERRLGLPRITQAFIAQYGLRVLSGPFASMVYVPQAVGSAFVPKLLGCYEAELHGVIDNILTKGYKTVIDIGCAAGYYANGLALRLPSVQVYAFDTDALGRRLCAEMAKANHVTERVHVEGLCDSARLNALLLMQALIVCDCEGCEVDLLCPDRTPGLERADILVELHDCVDPSISSTILSRFEATHDVILLTSVERDSSYYPALGFLSPADRRLAVSEFRPSGQQWAFLTPKSSEKTLA